MNHQQYTLIGTELPDFFRWAFGVLAVIGLIWTLSPRRRYAGLGLALGSVIVVLLRIPAPIALALSIPFSQVGVMIDRMQRRDLTRYQLIWDQCCTVLLIALLIGSGLLLPDRKEIAINDSLLQFKHSRFADRILSPKDMDLLGVTEAGHPHEWYITSKQSTLKDKFVGNLFEEERYWDHHGHILTGTEMGQRIATLTGAKPRFETSEKYYAQLQSPSSKTK